MVTKHVRAGVAFSCLLSVVAVVVLGSSADDLLRSGLLWVLYVLACGLAINLSHDSSIGRVIGLSVFPAGAFLIAATIFFWLARTANDPHTFGISETTSEPETAILKFNLIAIVTVFGITAAIYSRPLVIEYIAKLNDLPEKDLKSLQAKISLIGTIIATLLLVLLSVLPGRKPGPSAYQLIPCKRAIDLAHHRVADLILDRGLVDGRRLEFFLDLAQQTEIAVILPNVTPKWETAAGQRISLLDELQFRACEEDQQATRDKVLHSLGELMADLRDAKGDADIAKALNTHYRANFTRDLFAYPSGHQVATGTSKRTVGRSSY